MSYLLETLRLAADDPMWADHAEVPKKLLRHTVDRIEAHEVERDKQREHIRAQAEDIMKLGHLVYDDADPPATWKMRALTAEADKARLSEALRPFAAITEVPALGSITVDMVRDARAALSGSGSGWRLVPNGNPVTLDDCPEGLFLFNGHLGFMTEYATDKNDGFRQRDAYCGDSGEYFWGGTSNARERAKLIVQPMLPAAPQQGGE